MLSKLGLMSKYCFWLLIQKTSVNISSDGPFSSKIRWKLIKIFAFSQGEVKDLPNPQLSHSFWF